MSRKRFCEYMSLNRSTLYYKPKGEGPENLELMQEIDRCYLEYLTAGGAAHAVGADAQGLSC